MSDLQVSLLIIGVVVIGGVTAFNWFQQWRLRRRLERTFDEEREEEPIHAPPPRAGPVRLEPQLEPVHSRRGQNESALRPSAGSPGSLALADVAVVDDLPDVSGFDQAFDYIVAIDAAEPISAAGLAELHTKAAASGRRFRLMGFNADMQEWEQAARLSGGRYAHLRIAIPLVSRKGVIDGAALSALCDVARACAARFSAAVRCPDIDAALERAREVDAYCAEVDVAIGVNVVPPPGTVFAGARIRALAENCGFKLEPDGVFHYRDEARQTLFTLDNHEPAPFLPEQIKHLSTNGITLMLDVPRVTRGNSALELMLRTGAQLAEGLGGTLVDDNRVALSENSVHAIRQQLQSIHAKMEARGMAPGSEHALRLFS